LLFTEGLVGHIPEMSGWDIDFLTPDPYPINFCISISSPHPKISEI